jgi:hypothetical protein
MIHFALIVGLGLELYRQNEIGPTQGFAKMIDLLATSLVGELIEKAIQCRPRQLSLSRLPSSLIV